MKLTWYFDFISPFAYLQHCQFNRLPENVEVEYKPILLAGLLSHWNNVGPAEIEPKRVFTYKHCYWQAKKNNIAYKMPPAHPFNSLLPLRLSIALGCKKEVIQTIFETIWRQGLDINSSDGKQYLSQHLKVKDVSLLASDTSVKQQLMANSEQAANNNIFGVPSFSVKINQQAKPENFWGLDAFDMLLDYLKDPEGFNDHEMQRVAELPVGVQRKR